MATPNLHARSKDDPFQAVPAAMQSSRVEVLYATDRVPVPDKGGVLRYSAERSASLAVGTCTVEIGRNLSWAELVRESRTQLRSRPLPLAIVETHELVRFPPAPSPAITKDGKRIEDPNAIARQAADTRQLGSLLAERLSRTPRREAYVYIHGYNNEFQDGAFVIAQLWHFIGRTGVPIVYTWPAGSPFGLLRGYAHDRESGEFTVYHLKQFLRALAACPELEKVHLIAHSRGTDVLTTALRELHIEYTAAGRQTRSELKLGNVILAAADMDYDVAQQRIAAERLHLVPERITLYMSVHDRAIWFADWLFGSGRRLGQLQASDLTPEQRKALESLSQLQLIDVQVITNWLGHNYFYADPAVSSDVILLLRDNRGPGPENGRPMIKRHDNFWEIRDGYPRPAQ